MQPVALFKKYVANCDLLARLCLVENCHATFVMPNTKRGSSSTNCTLKVSDGIWVHLLRDCEKKRMFFIFLWSFLPKYKTVQLNAVLKDVQPNEVELLCVVWRQEVLHDKVRADCFSRLLLVFFTPSSIALFSSVKKKRTICSYH